MNKQCLISYASKGREDYNSAMTRNIINARKYYRGDMIYYSLDNPRQVLDIAIQSGLPKDCDAHSDVPYQFKPKLFKEAYDKGFRQILWLDSTVVLMKNIDKIFEECSTRGVVAFHNLGHNVSKWISDKAVKNIGLNLSEDPYQIMACVVGFDLDNKIGKKIFDKWIGLSEDGESFQNNPSTHEGFIAHRHDQACLSGLLWKEKIKLLPYGSLVYQPHDIDHKFGKDFYFVNKAI